MDVSERLGRRVPKDFRHVERFALAAAPAPIGPVKAGSWGINWYDNFIPKWDERARRWTIATEKDWGPVVGGHAICSPAKGMRFTKAWQALYDQIGGSCTGFSTGVVLTHHNRKRYDAMDIYRRAQLRDEWADTPPEEGSSVRAAYESVRLEGAKVVRAGKIGELDAAEGIAAYRWARSVEEVRDVLGYGPEATMLPLNQTWGPIWPLTVWAPLEAFDRLLSEDGEFAVPTDR